MPRFLIREFDNDYRAFVSSYTMEFPNRKEADDWCKANSWTGSDYYVDRKIDDA